MAGIFTAGDALIYASNGDHTLDGGEGVNRFHTGDGVRVMIWHSGATAAAFPALVYKFDLDGVLWGIDQLANFSVFAGGPEESQIRLGPQDDTVCGGAGDDHLDGGARVSTLVFLGEVQMGVQVTCRAPSPATPRTSPTRSTTSRTWPARRWMVGTLTTH